MTAIAPEALLIDYGGVLTESMDDWAGVACHGFDLDSQKLLTSIFGGATDDSPFGLLERGLITRDEFAELMTPVLNDHRLDPRGDEIDGRDWVNRISQVKAAANQLMVDAVNRLLGDGVPVVLLSNSWGPADSYPWHWLPTFTATVISGVEGVRKPSVPIYELAAERAGVPADRCVFVDDVALNLPPAEALGMTTVHHRDPLRTIARLDELFAG